MTSRDMISNLDNVHIKLARALLRKKRVRRRERLYVAEGLRLVAQALQVGHAPAFLFSSQTFGDSPAGQALLADLPPETRAWTVSDDVLVSISDTVTTQGVVALMPIPQPLEDALSTGDLILLLDEIRDPGNMGTILRTAEAAGVDAVLAMPGCADPYAPKVVRAGMGAHVRLAIHTAVDWERAGVLLRDRRCVLADGRAQAVYWTHDWRQPLALIIGNEAHGVSENARALANDAVRLPMAEGVESLNAAVAAGVLLFETLRQRASAGPDR